MSRLFGAAWLVKCVRTTTELNWCEQCAGLKKKLKTCLVLTSLGQLQNRSFHVANLTRTSVKCTKIARANRAKLLLRFVLQAVVFHIQWHRVLNSNKACKTTVFHR